MKSWKKNNKHIPDPVLEAHKVEQHALERELLKTGQIKPLNWFTPEFMAKCKIKHRSTDY